MRLIFYKLTETGQHEFATVVWDGKEVTHSGACEALLHSLFPDKIENLSPDDIRDAMRIAPWRFDGAYVQAELIEDMEEGGPGSGHRGHSGRPGVVGGSMSGTSAKKIRLTRHAFNRTKERTGFGPVRRALKALARMEVPEKEWHTELYQRQGRLAGYLQGFDGRVKTVLGPWYEKGKLSGEEIEWKR